MILKNNAPQLSNEWLGSFPHSPTKSFLPRELHLGENMHAASLCFFLCPVCPGVGEVLYKLLCWTSQRWTIFLSSCRHLTPPFPPYPLTLTPWPPKGKEEKLLFSYSSKGHTTRLSVVIRNRRYRLS